MFEVGSVCTRGLEREYTQHTLHYQNWKGKCNSNERKRIKHILDVMHATDVGAVGI